MIIMSEKPHAYMRADNGSELLDPTCPSADEVATVTTTLKQATHEAQRQYAAGSFEGFGHI